MVRGTPAKPLLREFAVPPAPRRNAVHAARAAPAHRVRTTILFTSQRLPGARDRRGLATAADQTADGRNYPERAGLPAQPTVRALRRWRSPGCDGASVPVSGPRLTRRDR